MRVDLELGDNSVPGLDVEADEKQGRDARRRLQRRRVREVKSQWLPPAGIRSHCRSGCAGGSLQAP